MPKLTDTDELKEWIENWFVKNAYYHPYSKTNNIPIPELYDILERIPTIDAVEVVRCKDCRFYRFYDGTFGKGWMCFENNTARHGDDFCSRGEKKDDADE